MWLLHSINSQFQSLTQQQPVNNSNTGCGVQPFQLQWELPPFNPTSPPPPLFTQQCTSSAAVVPISSAQPPAALFSPPSIATTSAQNGFTWRNVAKQLAKSCIPLAEEFVPGEGETMDDWLEVKLQQGQRGWISISLTKVS